MLLSSVGLYLNNNKAPIPQWILKIGNLCMGVYLIQQFILIALYRHTELPWLVSPYFLPWIGAFITMVLSVLVSLLARRTKVGRFLMG